MCDHLSHRFDPGMCAGNCAVCGAGTGAQKGQPTPMHQRGGTGTETCPGSGTPSL